MHGEAASGRRMKRVLTLACSFLLLAALLSLGCAGSDRLSVAAYAEFCADGIASAQDLIEPDAVTWGDLLDLGQPSLDRLRAVEPPEALGDFHRASLKALDLVVGVAGEQPADELANPLAFGLDALRIGTQLARSVDALPSEIRMRLREAGCL